MQNEINTLRDKVRQYETKSEEMELYGYKMKKYEKENQSLTEQIQNCEGQLRKAEGGGTRVREVPSHRVIPGETQLPEE